MYCVFEDYKFAFDIVRKIGLWLQLLNIGIDGKLFSVIGTGILV